MAAQAPQLSERAHPRGASSPSSIFLSLFSYAHRHLHCHASAGLRLRSIERRRSECDIWLSGTPQARPPFAATGPHVRAPCAVHFIVRHCTCREMHTVIFVRSSEPRGIGMGSGLAVSAGIHAGAQASKRRRGAEGVLLVRILLPAASASVVLVERLSSCFSAFSGAPRGVISRGRMVERPRHRFAIVPRSFCAESAQNFDSTLRARARIAQCTRRASSSRWSTLACVQPFESPRRRCRSSVCVLVP